MSGFGLIVLLLFVIATAGIMLLSSNGSEDLPLAKILFGVVLLMTVAELLLCVIEFPLYVVDVIQYACMGLDWLYKIMIVLYLGIIVFILFMILPKLKWKKIFNVSVGKVIVCGVLIFGSMLYNELFNGSYSFDSHEEFAYAKSVYEQYDDGFLPMKLLKLKTDDNDIEMLLHISVYPFDAHSAAGDMDFRYRAEVIIDPSSGSAGFYPFTYNIIMGKGQPVSFDDPTYIPESRREVSPSDAAQAAQEQQPAQEEQTAQEAAANE